MSDRVSPELRRSIDDRMIFGVASGLADYFGVDIVLTRVLFVVSVFFSAGSTLLAYLLLAIFVPEQERSTEATDSKTLHRYRTSSDTKLVEHRRNVGGWIIVGLGILMLATNFGLFSWLSFGRFWPVLLIALGLAIVFGAFRSQKQGR